MAAGSLLDCRPLLTTILGTGQISRGVPLGSDALLAVVPTIGDRSNVWPSIGIERSNLPISDLSPLRKSTHPQAIYCGFWWKELGTGRMFGHRSGSKDRTCRYLTCPLQGNPHTHRRSTAGSGGGNWGQVECLATDPDRTIEPADI